MKVRLTIDVGDGLRRRIAQELSDVDKTRDGKAGRKSCSAWLQEQIDKASLDWEYFFPRPTLTAQEEHEAALAFDWLRKQGRTDEQIRGWLLLERARYRFPIRSLEGSAHTSSKDGVC